MHWCWASLWHLWRRIQCCLQDRWVSVMQQLLAVFDPHIHIGWFSLVCWYSPPGNHCWQRADEWCSVLCQYGLILFIHYALLPFCLLMLQLRVSTRFYDRMNSLHRSYLLLGFPLYPYLLMAYVLTFYLAAWAHTFVLSNIQTILQFKDKWANYILVTCTCNNLHLGSQCNIMIRDGLYSTNRGDCNNLCWCFCSSSYSTSGLILI